MSFAASHSGCQASTKIGATPAHTGKVHTQVVSCLCFVSTERQLLHFWPKRVEFRSDVDRFCIWVQNVARKWQSHGFAVDGAYCLGFSTFLSEKCNWERAHSLGFGTLEAAWRQLSSFLLDYCAGSGPPPRVCSGLCLGLPALADSIWVPPPVCNINCLCRPLSVLRPHEDNKARYAVGGFLGSASWALRFLSCLRQAVSDTLALQPSHHRLSSADRSVALYSREDIIPMVRLQARVVAAFRSGFRPLQPVARGLVAPLDDFPVVLPSGSLPSLDSAALPPDCLPDVPVPPPVTSPPAPADSPPPLPMLPGPSAPASEDDLVSLSSEESAAPPADQDEVEDWEADLVEKAAIKAASAAPWLMHNPRSNVVHFAQTCTSDTLRSIRMLRQDGSAVHVRPACGAQTCQMIPGPLLSAPPAGSVLCLRGACFSRLSQLD